MNRGRRSDRIFEDRNDYMMFIDVLKEATEVRGVLIAAYCMMSKHTIMYSSILLKENSRDACDISAVSIRNVSTEAKGMMGSCFVGGLSQF